MTAAARIPGKRGTVQVLLEVEIQLLGSIPEGLQAGSKFAEKEYYSLLSPVLSCLKC